jgi:hypothetical protein
MLGLDVIEVMTPSGHPSIINKIRQKKTSFSQILSFGKIPREISNFLTYRISANSFRP